MLEAEPVGGVYWETIVNHWVTPTQKQQYKQKCRLTKITVAFPSLMLRQFALATGASIVTSAKFEVQESIYVVPCNYELNGCYGSYIVSMENSRNFLLFICC